MQRSLLRGFAIAAPVLLGLACLAAPSIAVQRTVTIYQIQDTTSVGHVVEGSTDTVTTTGILTGADVRSTGFGFYIQDAAGGNFSGVLVFTGGANVFADSGYARGDIIRATGRTTEFGGETEIISSSGGAFNAPPTTTKLGTAALPAPIAIANYGLLAETAAYPVAEKYEGVRVSIVNGRTARTNIGLTNQWLVVDNNVVNPLDSIRVDGQTLAFPGVTPPAIGVVATAIQGIGVQRTPRGYGLQLRDNADITVPSPPVLLNAYAISNAAIQLQFDRALDPVTSQQVGNYSRTLTLGAVDGATLVNNQYVNLATTTNAQIPGEAEEVTATGVRSALGVAMAAPGVQQFRAGITPIQMVQTNENADSSQFVNEQVTVRGTVMAIDEGLYFFQDGVAVNPSSGMAVFGPMAGMAEGDDVTMSGIVTEFGGGSQLTEFSGLDYQRENSTGNPKYVPVAVTPGQIGPLTGVEPFPGERYEAMFVRLSNVTVTQDSLPNGQYAVQGSGGTGDTVRVDDTMYRSNILYDEGVGVFVTRLDGIVNDAFGQFTINPRRSTDLQIEPVGVPGLPTTTEFAIRSIQPTPASFARGTAMLNFVLPSAGRVSARVYDLAGRLVAQPFTDVDVAAGPQSLGIDGRTVSGGRLGSGIYFIQLELGNRVATAKLVVTE
ncbi:MAG: T9SS type A sorting domain-containing protein [Candidatus Eiseniibacteriota bacterium]